MAAHALPRVARREEWIDGLRLRPEHFRALDDRMDAMAHLHGLAANPWPWGFTECTVDETALAGNELRLNCEGVFPNGRAFSATPFSVSLVKPEDGASATYHATLAGASDATERVVLTPGSGAASDKSLPAAKLTVAAGVWSQSPDWSAPALLIGPDHPLRAETKHQLGALAAVAAGFMATLRMPGAEERPAVRTIFQVASALAQGVTVLEGLLEAPAVPPVALGQEALRLAAAVRAAVGAFDPTSGQWDANDQRGSLRQLLYIAESTASQVGLPFRARRFTSAEVPNVLATQNLPLEPLLLVIEGSQPAEVIAARSWLEGAAIASADRVQVALTRRVGGCSRKAIERDARLGVASGPLVALYRLDYEAQWRDPDGSLAIAAGTAPPANTAFLIFLPELGTAATSGPQTATERYAPFEARPWAESRTPN